MKFKIKNEECKMGFTLVELLVVITIIGILAALLFPALSRAKDRAIRVKCMSNIHQIDLGMLAYANENRDRLPPSLGADPEPWDMPAATCSWLQTIGVTRSILYDPGFAEFDSDAHWNDAPDLWRDVGYLLTLPGITPIQPAYQNATIVPQPIQIGAVLLPAPMPSKRVLVAGMVISGSGENNTNTSARAAYNYTHILDDGTNLIRCPHLDSRRQMPTGDNSGMLDGSTKWVKFDSMVPRSTPNGFATFWW